MELVADKETKQVFDLSAGVGLKCMAFAHEHGLIPRAMGDTMALCPPLIPRLNKVLRVPPYPIAEAILALACGFRLINFDFKSNPKLRGPSDAARGRRASSAP